MYFMGSATPSSYCYIYKKKVSIPIFNKGIQRRKKVYLRYTASCIPLQVFIFSNRSNTYSEFNCIVYIQYHV